MKKTLKKYYDLMDKEIENKENLIMDFIKDILENNKDFLDTKMYPIYYIKDETYTIYSDLIRIFYNEKNFLEVKVNNIAKIDKENIYEFMKTKITRFVLSDDNPYAKDNDFEIIIESDNDLKYRDDLQYLEQYIEIWDEIIPDIEKELIKDVLYKQGIEEYDDEFKYKILEDIEYETLDVEYIPNQLLKDKKFVRRLNELGYDI